MTVPFHSQVFLATVGAHLPPMGACCSHVLINQPSFHPLVTVSIAALLHSKWADILCVLLSISQVSLPVTSPLKVGALHYKTHQSSLVEMVWSCGEPFTVNRANLCPFDAVLTEQVPTTGLHWVRDQLQTNRTLKLFQKLFWSVYKLVFASLVYVGSHAGMGGCNLI